MDNNTKTNLSKIERVILYIYIVYIILVKLIFDKFLFGITFLIIMVFISVNRKNNSTQSNYLIKEKLEIIVRQHILLSIFYSIILEAEGVETFISIVITIFLLLILLLPFAGILKAISKIEKIETYQDIELYRELPQKIEPAVVAYIIQDNILDRSDISATLLDLVRRGYLIMENDIEKGFNKVADGILSKKLVINNNKDFNKLKDYEKFLISWFQKTSNNSNEINMSKIKEMLKNNEDTKENYNIWEKLIKEEADKVHFFDNNRMLSKFSKFSAKWAKKVFACSMILAVTLIIVIATESSIQLPNMFYDIIGNLGILSMILSSLSIIIYNLKLPEEYLNEVGKENLRKWNGFIKFLKEYTLIDERKTEEVYIWEEYLVYGVAFGVAKKTINNMNEAYGLELYVK